MRCAGSNFLSGAVPIEFGELTDLKSVVLGEFSFFEISGRINFIQLIDFCL